MTIQPSYFLPFALTLQPPNINDIPYITSGIFDITGWRFWILGDGEFRDISSTLNPCIVIEDLGLLGLEFLIQG